jgi:hypothetical protein
MNQRAFLPGPLLGRERELSLLREFFQQSAVNGHRGPGFLARRGARPGSDPVELGAQRRHASPPVAGFTYRTAACPASTVAG